MSKFEQIGCNMQTESKTKEEAQRKFSRSCDICCNHGLQIKCDHCAVKEVHEILIAAMETAERKTA